MLEVHASKIGSPYISCTNLTKTYGEFVALKALTFKLKAGQILGLVGRNGAGKTTALRCMAGIIPLTSGEVLIDQIQMHTDAVQAKQRSCFVPDTPQLFPYLSVENHLRFAGRIHGLIDIDQRIASLLAKFELEEKADALPNTLSRGMRQKVAICLGLLHEPKAIFLDEPLTGLDPVGVRDMKDTIIQQAKEKGAAIIVSSHQLSMMEEVCDEIFILDRGQKVASGTIEQLRSQLGQQTSDMSLEELFFQLIDANKSATEEAR